MCALFAEGCLTVCILHLRHCYRKIEPTGGTTPRIAEMGAEKSTLEDRIFELRFSAKQLARDSEKAEKESQKAKKDVA